jgi:hypothetical protein
MRDPGIRLGRLLETAINRNLETRRSDARRATAHP